MGGCRLHATTSTKAFEPNPIKCSAPMFRLQETRSGKRPLRTVKTSSTEMLLKYQLLNAQNAISPVATDHALITSASRRAKKHTPTAAGALLVRR